MFSKSRSGPTGGPSELAVGAVAPPVEEEEEGERVEEEVLLPILPPRRPAPAHEGVLRPVNLGSPRLIEHVCSKRNKIGKIWRRWRPSPATKGGRELTCMLFPAQAMLMWAGLFIMFRR